MRLLGLHDRTKLNLTKHEEDKLPPYAILSHTWGSDDQEVSFDDVQRGEGKNKSGYRNILFCGEQALKDDLKDFWVDTCCIDKNSHSELSEAITSMFRWYQKATKCYVYLSDVSKAKCDRDGRPCNWKDAFRKSRWFTRGWTLQELLAPEVVEFWSKDEHRLGTKESLKDLICGITGIPTKALLGAPLPGFPILERQRWAAKRETKKKEDKAYCLFGIFDVSIPVLYGEGEDKARRRLLQAINPLDDTAETPRQRVLASLEFEQRDARHSTIAKAHRKTCEWLLQHPDYIDWSNNGEQPGNNGILWIVGKAGAGKSTLMKFALEQVRKNRKQEEIVLSFFFNARGDELEKTTRGMYRALILQLLEEVPELQHVLDNVGNASFRQSSTPTWTLSGAQDLFSDAVGKIGPRKLTIFIDALDECAEEEVRDMVDFLENLGEDHLSDETRLSICFASRHYPSIQIQYSRRLILEDEEGHAEDLRRYIHGRLQKNKNDEIIDEVREMVQQRANGVFMWVVLVVGMLDEEFKRGRLFAVKEKLQAIPTGLSDLFKQLLQRDDKDMGDLLLCLQWILFAKRPLSREEFYYAMVTGLHGDGSQWEHVAVDYMDSLILHSSKGLAELTKSEEAPTVQFIHESVRDFLLKDGGLQTLWPELDGDVAMVSHKRLQECCANYLAADLSKYLNSSQPLPEAWSDEARALREQVSERFPLLKYASHGFLYHANEATHIGTNEIVLQAFALKNWVCVNNLFIPLQGQGYLHQLELLYVLAENNFSQLLGSTTVAQMIRDKKLDINAEGGDYGNALQVASLEGCEDVVQMLLDAGADVNAQGGQFGNALQAAFAWGQDNNEKVVQMLLDAGADVNAQGGQLGTALHAAVASGQENNEKVVQMLLDAGADVNAQGGDYGNALQTMVAGESGKEKVVQMLLDAGVDVNAQGGDSGNALQAAVKYGDRNEKVVQMLLDAGADVNQTGDYGNALQALMRFDGEIEKLVQMLLDAGADPTGDYGYALQAASGRGDVKLVQMLLDAGAEVNAKGGYYGNALQAAASARGGNEKVVQMLLDAGAEISCEGGEYAERTEWFLQRMHRTDQSVRLS